ncbi:thiamine pyrophosphate-dependent enzyme [Blastococcus brunescens]|uniref:Thiamine pyrophosphate-dependent enzyme n=1 Tax=Blastococcus brunescens TaxID=1564165 RepID=A0ABZ1B8X8_9ACTN|nr:thiamine pyrophosphate-dependent enzyme [Blastococcus sp. BMG 8361]WRL67211.1 thiamine pyrophosphate-dependent enzyme [Blastococcus sp. BMG 8361]
MSRDPEAWRRRIELAERIGARVVTDLKMAAAFPTDHELHGGSPGNVLTGSDRAMLSAADVLLALEWEDLGGTLATAFGDREPDVTVIAAGSEHELFNGWTKNDYALAPVDISLNCHPDDAVHALACALRVDTVPREMPHGSPSAERAQPPSDSGGRRATVAELGQRLHAAVGHLPTTLAHVPTSWQAEYWPMGEPLSFLGSDGGGGIGSGPGIAVGAALALKGSGRFTIAVLGDGDTLMGLTALWTAARYEIPLLVVVANNGSYFNDELHQDRIAMVRGRPRENAHIGMRTEEPQPNIAGMAESMGLVGIGPVGSLDEVDEALARAVEQVEAGRPAVVDVFVGRGYPSHAGAGVLSERPGVSG